MKTSGFRVAIASLLVCIGVTVFPSISRAVLISSPDLFLAPSLVGEGSYEFHELTGLDGSSGLVRSYTSSDMEGATIIGARILPLLNPNPSTSQGQYSAADLLTINSGNYLSYFFAKPNEDYFADLDSSGLLSIEYYAAGSYFVEVTAKKADNTTFTKIFEDGVDDFQGGLPGQPRDRTKPGRVIPTPKADLSIVSNPAKEPLGTNGYSQAGFLTLQQAGQNPQKADTVQDVINRIQAACQANGGPISVTVVGHGASGAVQIGDSRITNAPPRPGKGDMTPAAFQAAIDNMNDGSGRRCVKAIDFYSCNVNTNTPGKTQGTDFMNAMQASIADTRAFNQFTTAAAPYTVFNRRTNKFVTVNGYFDVGAGGVLGGIDDLEQLVPEPSGTLLIVTALGALLIVRRRRIARTLLH